MIQALRRKRSRQALPSWYAAKYPVGSEPCRRQVLQRPDAVDRLLQLGVGHRVDGRFGVRKPLLFRLEGLGLTLALGLFGLGDRVVQQVADVRARIRLFVSVGPCEHVAHHRRRGEGTESQVVRPAGVNAVLPQNRLHAVRPGAIRQLQDQLGLNSVPVIIIQA